MFSLIIAIYIAITYSTGDCIVYVHIMYDIYTCVFIMYKAYIIYIYKTYIFNEINSANNFNYIV